MQSRYSIYVIQLTSDVFRFPRFREENPGCKRDSAYPPLYVGMTGKSPEERFEQHRLGYKSSKYTGTHCLQLRPDLYKGLNPMTYDEAIRMEIIRAAELRLLGFPVWQN